jgi:protein-disulfide isomerase
MGGAERNARRKRQQRLAASRAVKSARTGGTDRTKIVIGLVVVLLLAGAVIGGVLYTNAKKNTTADQEIGVGTSTTAAAPAYPVRRDGAAVVAGKDGAKATVDFYEDFLCPHCKAFEQANSAAVQQKLNDGSLQVRYHMLAILNNSSDPAGYSLDAANAGLCAADGGQFPAFHARLFERQPEEGARGWDNGKLVTFGNQLGITSADFASCVNSGKYDQQVLADQDQVTKLPYLQQDFGNNQRGFGTPTVAEGQHMVDTSDPNWLNNLVNQA